MADIIVLQSRVKDLKIFIKKAIDEAKPDKKLLLSLVEKEANLIDDLLKGIEELNERLDLLEGKFTEK
jgi:hypothetical protein